MKTTFLKVKSPCTESWEEMTPSEKGRFCAACQKEVIDFTALSSTEIIHLLSERKNESLCGRMHSNFQKKPLLVQETLSTQNNFSFPRKNWSRLLILLSGTFLGFSSLGNTAILPQSVEIEKVQVDSKNKKQTPPLSIPMVTLKGQISSEIQPKGIENVKVVFLTKDKQYYTFSKADGSYELEIPKEVIQEKNVLYFDYSFIEIKEIREQKNEFYGYDDYFKTLTSKDLLNQLYIKANNINRHISGIIDEAFSYQSIVIYEGVEWNIEEYYELKFANIDASCDVRTSDEYYLYGDAAEAILNTKDELLLILVYDNEDYAADAAVF